jgi:hypothetical protein
MFHIIPAGFGTANNIQSTGSISNLAANKSLPFEEQLSLVPRVSHPPCVAEQPAHHPPCENGNM